MLPLTVPAEEVVAENLGIGMLRQLIVGGAVSVCNIAIHALVMALIVQVARSIGTRARPHLSLVLTGVMSSTVSVLMVTHSLEVMVWALAYWIVGLAPSSNNLVYFAFVNYTTLGYGDVIPAERWQLLGPITAMNGVLLFGWSTAVIFGAAKDNGAIRVRRASNDPRDDSRAGPVRESARPIGAAFLDVGSRIVVAGCSGAGCCHHGPDTKSPDPRHRA